MSLRNTLEAWITVLEAKISIADTLVILLIGTLISYIIKQALNSDNQTKVIRYFESKSKSITDDVKSKSSAISSNSINPISSSINLYRNGTIKKNSSGYHMDEETTTSASSSEYSSRGNIWYKRPCWHVSSANREFIPTYDGIDHVLAILNKFNVDPRRGFLPSQDPLLRLPYSRYHIWEDIADDLPKLLCARLGQARDPLKQLPVLKIDKLSTDRELRRAHLLLCLFAHAFVWGGPTPLDYIPEGILTSIS